MTSVTWVVFFFCLHQACLTWLDEEFVFNPLSLSSNLYQHLRRGVQSQPLYPYRSEKVNVMKNRKKKTCQLISWKGFTVIRNWGIKWFIVCDLLRGVPGCRQHPLAGTRSSHWRTVKAQDSGSFGRWNRGFMTVKITCSYIMVCVRGVFWWIWH